MIFTGCQSKLGVKYGDNDNELIAGSALSSIVNAENPTVFVPWCKIPEGDAIWGTFIVEFENILRVRNAPVTHYVMIAKCKSILPGGIAINWIYRDDWQDGAVYRKLCLVNGLYNIAYTKSDHGIIVKSIKSANQSLKGRM